MRPLVSRVGYAKFHHLYPVIGLRPSESGAGKETVADPSPALATASTSAATWLHATGTSMPSAEKTIEPSGLRISLFVVRNAIFA